MKKAINIVLIIVIAVLQLSFVTYASEEIYDSAWELNIKNQDGENGKTSYFVKGDLIELTVKNSSSIENASDSVVHITYNVDLIEYVTPDDFYNVKAAFGTQLADVPYLFSDGAAGVANTENMGVFTAAFVSQEGLDFNGGETVFKVYFKVIESGISGVCPLNFRWIKKGVYASYIADNSDENKNFNINFKDLYVNVEGEKLSDVPTELQSSESRTFVPEVFPTGESPETVNLNGKIVNLTTPYFVTFSRLAITNSALKEAGVIISKTNENINLESQNITLVNAVNIGSDNCFGFLVYGSGLKTGTTYYTRVYATYEDGQTLYGKIIPVEIKGE